jgi:hypothetical protein
MRRRPVLAVFLVWLFVVVAWPPSRRAVMCMMDIASPLHPRYDATLHDLQVCAAMEDR